MNNIIPIFFTIDDAYAPFLAVALSSAISNCSPDRKYKAIVLSEGLSAENTAKLAGLAKENFSIEFVPITKGLESINENTGGVLRCDYFTLTIYFRLFIPAMFPQYDKGIYIDSDVAVTGDLAELFDTDIGDNYIGACKDLSVVDVPPLATYMEEAVGVSRYEYINSGVLLMNLKKLREVKIDEHFLGLLSRYRFDCIAPDQDYFNAMCHGNIYYLPEIWDAMPNEDKPPLEGAKLIHYNLFSKPWCYDGVQYEEYFWKYARNSGYFDEIMAAKDSYTDEQRASDAACKEQLAVRGMEIVESNVTFKKLFESGVKIRL